MCYQSCFIRKGSAEKNCFWGVTHVLHQRPGRSLFCPSIDLLCFQSGYLEKVLQMRENHRNGGIDIQSFHVLWQNGGTVKMVIGRMLY